MTGPVPARAPVPPSQFDSASGRPHLAAFCIATAVLVAGLAWPARADVTSTDLPHNGAIGATALVPVVDTRDEIDARERRSPRPVPAPQPLTPAPPSDGRDAPDPFVLADHGRYVLYSTQVGLHNVPVAVSADLHNWSQPTDALPQLPDWAVWGRTWAPGVTQLGGRYLLYFAAHHHPSGRQCIGVAASATATGPFVSQAPEPLVCQTHLGGSIDPHPFVDSAGSAFLLWKADGNAIGQPSTLFAQRLGPDGLAVSGQPTALLTSGAAWEQPLIENPALMAAGQSYMLLYSGGWWESDGYAIGYATCETPLGPCTKATIDGPLLASGEDLAGPGGASVVTGPAGDQWLAFHAWHPGAVGYESGGTRSLRFAVLSWRDGRPLIGR